MFSSLLTHFFSQLSFHCVGFLWSGNYLYVSDVFQAVCRLGVSASRRHPDVSCPPSSVSLCLQAWCWGASCSSHCVSGRRPRLTAGWTFTGICGRRLMKSCTETRYVIKTSGCKYVRVFLLGGPKNPYERFYHQLIQYLTSYTLSLSLYVNVL